MQSNKQNVPSFQFRERWVWGGYVCGIPTINLPLQGVSLPFQLCFRAGTLQFDAGHLQFVRMLQTVNLRTRKKKKNLFFQAGTVHYKTD